MGSSNPLVIEDPEERTMAWVGSEGQGNDSLEKSSSNSDGVNREDEIG
jgi:hypothetical protein